MKSPEHKNYTVCNNVHGTHNLLNAIVETGGETHLVHLGIMGVYRYGHEEPVPDGYLDTRFDTRNGREVTDSIVYPPNPGSVLSHDEGVGRLHVPVLRPEERTASASPISTRESCGAQRPSRLAQSVIDIFHQSVPPWTPGQPILENTSSDRW